MHYIYLNKKMKFNLTNFKHIYIFLFYKNIKFLQKKEKNE